MEENPTTPLVIEPARHDAPGSDMSRHTFTIKQAADRFASLGVPRSPRSVQRFCELGNLDCIRVKGEKTERYFVDPLSVERYAEELRQLENISQLGMDTSRHDATERDTTRHDAPASNVKPTEEAPAPTPTPEPSDELRSRLDAAEKEKMQLQIDVAARTYVINQMTDERRHFLDQIVTQSREIGRLETRVQQLAAPQPDVTRHDATVVEVPPEPERVEPTPPPQPEKRKPWWRR